jgi:hypothetical protein
VQLHPLLSRIKQLRSKIVASPLDAAANFSARWCFADRGTAETFAAEFSGTLLVPE